MKRLTIALALLGWSCLQPTPQKAVPAPQPPAVSPTQATNDKYVSEVSARIVGHENDPAEQVFKNVQIPWLKKVPAGRFLTIMNRGYSHALGVTCTHCHDVNDFASDVKRPKLAAREMAEMHHAINDQLNKMQHLDPAKKERFINCTTCHRGAVDPNSNNR